MTIGEQAPDTTANTTHHVPSSEISLCVEEGGATLVGVSVSVSFIRAEVVFILLALREIEGDAVEVVAWLVELVVGLRVEVEEGLVEVLVLAVEEVVVGIAGPSSLTTLNTSASLSYISNSESSLQKAADID